jgi:hypothetical protein
MVARRKRLEHTSGGAASAGVIQRQRKRGDGKEVLDDLTRPEWKPHGPQTLAGKKAITGAELKLLMKGAVESAWKTYAYHATKSANVASIADSGLDPRHGGTGAAKGSTAFEEHSKGHAHYTRKLDVADVYRRHLTGDSSAFPGRAVETPEDAEILQVAIHAEDRAQEEADPDSKARDYAYRTRSRIPGKYIRRLAHVPIPAKPDSRKKAAPLVRGANERAWAEHVIRGQAEGSAFRSNMPAYATAIMYDMMKRGLEVTTVNQMIRQGLRSMSIDAIMELTPGNIEVNPRLVFQDRLDPTGQPLPDKK